MNTPIVDPASLSLDELRAPEHLIGADQVLILARVKVTQCVAGIQL